MLNRLLIAAFVVLFLVGLVSAAWSLFEWPPQRLILESATFRARRGSRRWGGGLRVFDHGDEDDQVHSAGQPATQSAG